MFGYISVILVLVIIISFAFVRLDRGYRNDIYAWSANHHEDVSEIDKRTFSNGPFWVTRHRYIYRVSTAQGHTYWFRFGGWGSTDIYEQIDGRYKKLQ